MSLSARIVPAVRSRRLDVPVRAALAAALLVVVLGVTGGDYLARNQALMAKNTGEGPAVSSAEVEGFRAFSASWCGPVSAS